MHTLASLNDTRTKLGRRMIWWRRALTRWRHGGHIGRFRQWNVSPVSYANISYCLVSASVWSPWKCYIGSGLKSIINLPCPRTVNNASLLKLSAATNNCSRYPRNPWILELKISLPEVCRVVKCGLINIGHWKQRWGINDTKWKIDVLFSFSNEISQNINTTCSGHVLGLLGTFWKGLKNCN